MDINLRLNTCKRTIFHIIFNLYSTIIRSAKQSGHIKLIVSYKPNEFGLQIKFCLSTNITTIKAIKESQNSNRDYYGQASHYQKLKDE